MLDRAHVGPIVDYIWNRRFEPVIEYIVRDGAQGRELVERAPEQPNFSMRGRTVGALLRVVDVWHGELAGNQNRPMLHWAKSKNDDFEFTEGSIDDRRTWTIRELLSTEELITESQRMSHCVASYERSCVQGKCSIWSVELLSMNKFEPRLTIELGHPDGEIRQVRGKFNRRPNNEEVAILSRWKTTLGTPE